MELLGLITGYLICGLIGILGLLVLSKIANGSINLSRLISEPNGDASISRFQFLVFTFVISLSLFLVIVSAKPAAFPNIPNTVLALLGISGSSYLISKGIQFSNPAGIADRATDIVISPSTAIVRYGQTQQFKADVPRKPGSTVTWQVIAGGGTITATGLYSAPAAAPAAPAQTQHATIQVTSDQIPNASDVAVVTLA